jgi:uncharacterized protein (UPF0276 family)
MAELATPISTLFNERNVIKAIKGRSGCFECRENSPDLKKSKQYLFHFEKSIVSPWSPEEAKFFNAILASKRDLKLVTFHVLCSCSVPDLQENVFYPGGKNFSRIQMIENAKKNIRLLKRCIGKRSIEIAIENNNYYPTGAYRHITDGDFIRSIVSDNGILFLFDIAHAKITAHNKKISYKGYVSRLPLDKMVQIHISKEAIGDNNLAYDAHGLPDEEMLHEVKELVDTYKPRYLTIEYYKDVNNLLNILEKYGQLCGERKG